MERERSAHDSGRASDRLLDGLGLIFLAAAMLAAAWLGFDRPSYNWDMIPYVVLADGTPGQDMVARHRRAYAAVEAAAPAQDWALLTQASGLRIKLHRDPAAFEGQLGMYRIKAGYVATARVLGRAMPVITAYRLINLLAFLIIAATALWWMTVGRFAQAAFFVVPAFMLSELHSAGDLVTPDLLCAALALLGLALLRRGPWPLAAACFTAATLVRPDFIFFPAALLVAAAVMKSGSRQALVCFGAAAAAFLVTMTVGDHPGWWPHFVFSLARDAGPVPPPISVGTYLFIATRALVMNVIMLPWPAMTVMLAAGWPLTRGKAVYRPRQADVLFLGLLLSLVVRCAVFPLVDQRLYMPTIIMGIMMLAERWSPRFGRVKTFEVESVRA